MKNMLYTLAKTTLYYWMRIATAPVVFLARWLVKHADANPVQKVEVLDKIDEIEENLNELKES